MSDKWLVSADDPTITCRAFADRLAKTANRRHRAMLETVIEHDQAEGFRDLDRTMATLAEDPVYGRFWSCDDVAPAGYAEVREYYGNLFASGGIGNLRTEMRTIVVDDHAIVCELVATSIWPWQQALKLGCEGEEGAGHYALHRPLVTVIPFDDQLKIRGETSYGGAFSWERVPDDELSPGYLAWADQFHPSGAAGRRDAP